MSEGCQHSEVRLTCYPEDGPVRRVQLQNGERLVPLPRLQRQPVDLHVSRGPTTCPAHVVTSTGRRPVPASWPSSRGQVQPRPAGQVRSGGPMRSSGYNCTISSSLALWAENCWFFTCELYTLEYTIQREAVFWFRYCISSHVIRKTTDNLLHCKRLLCCCRLSRGGEDLGSGVTRMWMHGHWKEPQCHQSKISSTVSNAVGIYIVFYKNTQYSAYLWKISVLLAYEVRFWNLKQGLCVGRLATFSLLPSKVGTFSLLRYAHFEFYTRPFRHYFSLFCTFLPF